MQFANELKRQKPDRANRHTHTFAREKQRNRRNEKHFEIFEFKKKQKPNETLNEWSEPRRQKKDEGKKSREWKTDVYISMLNVRIFLTFYIWRKLDFLFHSSPLLILLDLFYLFVYVQKFSRLCAWFCSYSLFLCLSAPISFSFCLWFSSLLLFWICCLGLAWIVCYVVGFISWNCIFGPRRTTRNSRTKYDRMRNWRIFILLFLFVFRFLSVLQNLFLIQWMFLFNVDVFLFILSCNFISSHFSSILYSCCCCWFFHISIVLLALRIKNISDWTHTTHTHTRTNRRISLEKCKFIPFVFIILMFFFANLFPWFIYFPIVLVILSFVLPFIHLLEFESKNSFLLEFFSVSLVHLEMDECNSFCWCQHLLVVFRPFSFACAFVRKQFFRHFLWTAANFFSAIVRWKFVQRFNNRWTPRTLYVMNDIFIEIVRVQFKSSHRLPYHLMRRKISALSSMKCGRPNAKYLHSAKYFLALFFFLSWSLSVCLR